MAFVPLYDRTGTTQLTIVAQKWKEVLSMLKTETVVKATGVVAERPDKDQNQVRNESILCSTLYQNLITQF